MKRKQQQFWLALILLLFFVGWGGYKQLKSWLVEPEMVLVLGGAEERERYAAKLAKKQPEVKVLVSSGSPKWYAQKIFQKEGIKRDRVRLDYRAQDTVTNFTTLVEDLKSQGVDSVYLVTSENHMTRARVIGEIVFGSRGITLKPVAVPTEFPPESWQKSVRDGARSLLWLATGRTGASFKNYVSQEFHSSEVPAPEHRAEQSGR
ncbi:MAG: YdcF family protein [Halothece sp.]